MRTLQQVLDQTRQDIQRYYAEQTSRSVQDAKLAQLRERHALAAEFGITFDPHKDGHILPERRTT